MGERITGGGAEGNGMHAERGSEGKNGHMWINECTALVCKNMIKTINHQNKDHTSHTRVLETSLFIRMHSSLILDCTSAEPQYYFSFPVCVVFTVFFQSDRKSVVSLQFNSTLKNRFCEFLCRRKYQFGLQLKFGLWFDKCMQQHRR